jgi:predicted amidohydrolase
MSHTPHAPLTLALLQCANAAPEAGTGEALRRLDQQARHARAQGADLLICPEMSLTGYAIGAERVQALAESQDGPLARAVATIARQHRIAIVYGYPERHPAGGKPFNAVQCIDDTGEPIGHYRKTHLFGELDHQQFTAGDAASQVFACRGWQLGMLICYDVEFPETTRLLALQGADAVLVPTANMTGFDEVPRLLVPSRACENRVVVAYANACGQEAGVHYGGLSTVVQADGGAMTCAGRDPQVLQVTLAPSALAQARLSSPLPCRRPDLYGELTRPAHP